MSPLFEAGLMATVIGATGAHSRRPEHLREALPESAIRIRQMLSTEEIGTAVGCFVCGKGSELDRCRFCQLVFHSACVTPPAPEIPETSLQCRLQTALESRPGGDE